MESVKRIIWTTILVLLAITAVFFSAIGIGKTQTEMAYADGDQPVATWDISATESDNVIANLYDNGDNTYRLDITGSGDMKSFTSYAPWYSENGQVTSASIEYGITSIGDGAFLGCTGLTEITIPDSVTSIGMTILHGCTSLESLTIPFVGNRFGVTSSDTYQYPLGYLFGTSDDCGGVNVRQYFYNDTIVSTAHADFYFPTSLRTVTVTGGYIPYGAFFNCSFLTNINMYNVTGIGGGAFYGCTGLTEITIPDSVTSIGMTILHGCTSLESLIIPFVGNRSGVTSSDTNQYPLGYLFGTSDDYNGVKVRQYFYYDTVISTTFADFYFPSTLHTIKVTGEYVPYGAFYNCTFLTNITIGNNVTEIGGKAFFGCTAEIAWEDDPSIREIGRLSFGNYYGESLTIPNSVTSIAPTAFLNCRRIKNITIPNSVINIGEYAFVGCNRLISCSIGDNVKSIGAYAFYNCVSLSTIIIPDGIVSTGEYAFTGCDNLEYNYYNDGCYLGNTNHPNIIFVKVNNIELTSIVLASTTKIIYNEAFSNCSSLTNITIPNTITNIGSSAFSNCSSLTNITIPDSVIEIGETAFDGCNSLQYNEFGNGYYLGNAENPYIVLIKAKDTAITSVSIAESTKYVCDGAFENCVDLQNVNYLGDIASWCEITFEGTKSNPLLYAHTLYIDNERITEITIPNTVSEIKNHVFEGWNGTNITIPNSITKIGEYAFANCNYLVFNEYDNGYYLGNDQTPYLVFIKAVDTDISSCIINDNAKFIASEAFYSCAQLTDIVIPNGVERIPYACFTNCKKLSNIVIPDSVRSIGKSAFYRCSSLTHIDIPNKVTTIERTTFAYSGLGSITIPDGVTHIKRWAFFDCNVGTIKISDSVKIIESLNISSSTESIYYLGDIVSWCDTVGVEQLISSLSSMNSFLYIDNKRMTGLYDWDLSTGEDIDYKEDIILPEDVVVIRDGAFRNWYYTKRIVIPEGIKSIGDNTFENCYNLREINIPDSVVSIGESAFAECQKLTKITIPASVMAIGENAFLNCYKLVEVCNKSALNITKGSTQYGRVGFYAIGICTQSYESKLSTNEDGYILYIDEDEIVLVDFIGKVTSNLVLPEGITGINQKAFARIGSVGFSAITIPASVTGIGYDAFDYMHSPLSRVYYKGDLHNWLGIAFNDSTSNPLSMGADLYFDGELMADDITIPDTVTEIKNYAFANWGGTNITIPNSITSIGDGAFLGCTGLTEIVIPDSVIYIGSGVFSGCKYLQSITVPFVGNRAGVTSNDTFQYPLGFFFGSKPFLSGYYSLKQCYYGSSTSNTSYTTYWIPSSLKSVTVIGGNILYGAFYNCSGLTSITIGDNVLSIGEYSFNNCTGLTSITIPDSATSIGDYAFYNCTGLTSITIGDNVLSIGEYSFNNCTGLTSITIPDSVTSIGGFAFNGCSGLISITIGDNVLSIGERSFNDCAGLTSITIPDSVTSIGNWAFSGCCKLVEVYNKSSLNITKGSSENGSVGCYAKAIYTEPYESKLSTDENGYIIYTDGEEISLIGYIGTDTELILPNGISKIYLYALGGCSSLTSITIPDSVTSIGNSAFYNCRSLTSITIPDSVTSIGGEAFNNCPCVTTYNSIQYVGDWLISSEKSITTAIIKEGTRGIANSSFNGCSSLTSITIPDSVTSIGSYAFRGCSSLTSITIPDSVKSIGEWAFYNCRSLTSVTIGNGVTSIGDYAFYNCIGLTSVAIGDNVSSIGSYAFSGCTATIAWGKNPAITTIGTYAFSGYNGTSITIPDSATSIGDYAFSGCSGLTSITIGDNVSSIGRYAFSGCSNLTSITIPDSATSIGDYAFSGCSGLTSITIGDNVSSIGRYAFSGCSNLTSITIPDSVTSIGDSAFSSCTGLTSVTIGDSVTSIGYGAFRDCSSLTSITIPDSITSIGGSAFYNCSSLTSITIPDSVTSIEVYAFYDCTSLTNITIGNGVTRIGYLAFYQCCKLVEVYNKSSLNITKGSSENGSVGCYAKAIYTEPYESKLYTDENGYILYADGDSISLIGYSGTENQLILPEGITDIYQYAFYGCISLTSITIPDSVKHIGMCAFRNCDGLNSIVFVGGEEEWTAITKGLDWDYNANDYTIFYHTAHTLGNPIVVLPLCEKQGYTEYACSVCGMHIRTNYVDALGHDLIHHDAQGATCTEIGWNEYDTCSRCDYSTYIEIPAHNIVHHDPQAPTCTEIGWEAFDTCSRCDYTTYVELAALGHDIVHHDAQAPTCTQVGWEAYDTCSRCDYSTYVEIPVIPHNYTNRRCTVCGELDGSVGLEYKLDNATDSYIVTGIGSCSDDVLYIARYYNGKPVSGIDANAFNGQLQLLQVIIDDNISYIGADAFKDCTHLMRLTIGAGITSIGSNAFSGCYSLVEIYNRSQLSLEKSALTYGQVAARALEIYTEECDSKLSIDEDGYALYADGTDTLLVCYLGSDIELYLPEGITQINKYAFYGNRDITYVAIPEGVTIINSDAFGFCSNLSQILLPESLVTIGASSFISCTSLMSLTIPSNVTSIYTGSLTGAFLWCYRLVEIYNKSSLNIIKGSSSNGYVAANAKTVYRSNYSTHISIDEEGFVLYTDGENVSLIDYKGADLKLVIPDGVTDINQRAFLGRKDITTIAISGSVKSIGGYVLPGGDSLTDIYYLGTESQWTTINKNEKWDNGATNYMLHYHMEHTEGELISCIVSTCSEKGYSDYVCAECGCVYRMESPALGHDLIHHVAQAPTCTGIGLSAYDTCSRCDYTTYHEISALGHDYNAVVTPPTCAEEGYTTYTCNRCGDNYVDDYIEALGHNWQWVVDVPATKTYTGLKHESCERCGENRNANTVIPIIDCNHENIEKVERIDATCIADGKEEYWYCDECQKYFSDIECQWLIDDIESFGIIVTLGHDLIHHDARAQTCTEIGWEAYDTCSRCNYTTYVEITALGHDYQATSTVPTCTEQGYTTHTCSRCEDTYTDSFIKELGHDIIHHVERTATCTTSGWEAYDTCSRCDYTTYHEIPALGHEYESVIVMATCLVEGYTIHTCNRCEDIYIDSYVDPFGHDLIHHDAQGATCTEIGWNEYDTCSRCDYTTYEELASLGHDLIHHDAQGATCTEIGWNEYDTCSRCDYTTYEELAALGHDYVAIITVPTCTEEGYTTHTCSRCGDTYIDTYTEASGHLYEEHIVEPTCVDMGYKECVCTVCGYSYIKNYIMSRGHAFVLVEEREATCTEEGYLLYECSVCENKKKEIINPLEHRFDEWEVLQEATTRASGVRRHSCIVCGEMVEENYSLSLEIEEFTAKFDSIDMSKRKSVCFTAINNAIDAYNGLTAEEKELVKSDYDQLKQYVALYNERADKVNNDVENATKNAFSLLSAISAILSALWVALKNVL